MTNKDKLKQLANDIEFESVMFANEFKHSKKEDLRYYLWLCELNLWLFNKHNVKCIIEVHYNTDNMELSLINYISLLIGNGILKK